VTPLVQRHPGPAGGQAKALDVLAVRLNLVGGAGQDCGVSSGAAVDIGAFGKVVAQTALLETGPVGDRRWGASCAAGGRLYLKVTRVGDAFAAQALPLELAFRLEPAVTDPGSPAVAELAPQLPAPAAAKPVEIDGGTSFNDAPRLEPGTYTETVGSGETRYYRVRLGWGQRLTYRVGIPGQPGLGIQAGALYATIASPLRQPAEPSSGSDSSILVGRDDHELSGSTPARVRYANRDAAGSRVQPYSVDGDFYLVLDLSYPIGIEMPFSVPLTITVATDGATEPGPTYAANPATYGATPATAAAAPARPEPTSGLPGWALAAAAGVAGIAAVAALALRRRRAGQAR